MVFFTQNIIFSENTYCLCAYICIQHTYYLHLTFNSKESIIKFENQVLKIDETLSVCGYDKKNVSVPIEGSIYNEFDEKFWYYILGNHPEWNFKKIPNEVKNFYDEVENTLFDVENKGFAYYFSKSYTHKDFGFIPNLKYGQLYLKNQYNNKEYLVAFNEDFEISVSQNKPFGAEMSDLLTTFSLKNPSIYERNNFYLKLALNKQMKIIEDVLLGKKESEILQTIIVLGDYIIFDEYFIIEPEVSKYYGFLDLGQCPDDIFSAEKAPHVGNIPTNVLLNFMQNLCVFLDS